MRLKLTQSISEMYKSPARVMERANAGTVYSTSSDPYNPSNTVSPKGYFKSKSKKKLNKKLDEALGTHVGMSPTQKATIHKRLAQQFRSDEEQEIIDRIRFHIVRGDSMLRAPLASGDVTMNDIIDAIKDNRCISARERDIGSTNTETIVGTAIRDLYDVDDINTVRRIFGLEPIKPKQE